MRKMTIFLFLAALLAGCAGDGGAARRAYFSSLVGQPEAELVRSLGIPSRSFETSGRRFVAYDERRTDVLPGTGYPYLGGGFGGFYGFHRGYYGGLYVGGLGFPPEVVESRCETTFELAGGRVQGWTLRGNACG